MRKPTVLPCHRIVFGCFGSQRVEIVIVPCACQSYTSKKNKIKDTIFIATEHVGHVQQQVRTTRHRIEIVSFIQRLDAAFVLITAHMQTCPDDRIEISTERNAVTRCDQLAEIIMSKRHLRAPVQPEEHVRIRTIIFLTVSFSGISHSRAYGHSHNREHTSYLSHQSIFL